MYHEIMTTFLKIRIHDVIDEVTRSQSMSIFTRATFETPKYPRRPRDQYMAQMVITLELSVSPPNRG